MLPPKLPTRVLLLVAILLVLPLKGFAQSAAARPDRGVMPNGSYSVSDIENINLQNGNVNLEIPLASLPPIAGSKLSWTIKANYNSKVWNMLRTQQDAGGQTWAPYVVSHPSADGGWVIGGSHTMIFRNAMEDFQRLPYPTYSGLSQSELNLLNNNDWWKVVLRMPDGSEHEFRPTDYSPYSGSQEFLKGFFNVIPNGTPIRYYSVDGTYMYARITTYNDWTVYLPDGTQIVQTPDNVQRLKDTNGNKIKIFTDSNGTHFQDEQTGRELRLKYNAAGDTLQLWYNTVGGVAQHIDILFGSTTVQGKLYTQNGDGHCIPAEVLGGQLQVVREIVFPQTEPGQPQRKLTFSYNSDSTTTATDTVLFQCGSGLQTYTRTVSQGLGELSRIEMPSGSVVEYSYTHDGIHDLRPFGLGDHISEETITEKRLIHDGTIDTWTYSYAGLVTVTSPDGSTFSQLGYCTSGPGCTTTKSGLIYRTIQPFTKTEKHWTNLIFSGANTNTADGAIVFNPVVDKEYTTLTDAQGNNLKMSAKVFTFDYNGNVTQETHYDWFDPALVSRDAEGVPTGVPASATVLRVVNTGHYNQASTASSTNVYAKRAVATGAPLILNATQQTTQGPAIAQFSYDGQAYGVAPTVGNVTSKKVWDDLGAKWITMSNTYDAYGNVAISTDARGKTTQFFYEDATHALATRVVVDPQNGTGTQTISTAYDYATGLVVSQTDANGQVSTIDYTNQLLGTVDPFGRPGVTKSPVINIGGTNHRHLATTTYLDSTRQVIVASDLNTENDKLLKTRTTADMLGRPILTESTEDGTNYTVSVKNAYHEMGRVTLTSSAMRSTASSTDSWTRVTKDIAGRVVEVATFGGATQPAWTGTAGVYTGKVTTPYEANFTTVTDQAGKVRRSMVDALGQLRRVDEPDAANNLGSTASPSQPTSYTYDSLGNLITVTQGSQTRTFTYDSLSRLRSAVNPESGTISYQYDDNGNLIVKTDARNASAHYEYDALNRATRRWYNGSNSISATTHNSPALPAGVGATDEVKFFYDSQSLPIGAPSYSRGAAVGRMVAQTYGTGSNGDYYGFDVLGRATLKIQQTGTVNYQLGAAYSLSGAVNTLTYPSGHTVTNAFDQAGRLTGFSGNLGDGTTRTYASGILYGPGGALVKEQFGTTTPIYNKLFYNSRGQLAEIRESTTYTGPTDYSADRGAIVNNYSNQCAGLCSGISMPDNNGNLLKQENHIPSQTMRWQQYDYDSLNRLNWVREVLNGGAEQWKQQFTYDRWGNRTINTTNTYGTGINNKAFTVNTANNRLGVPGGQSGTMSYDYAGNLTNDTYTGAGNRTYDGENRITSAWGGNNQAQLYAYDASGQRIKRAVDGAQTWQVYGFGGELVAEYAANGPASNPQKEYGYRNGQLLITASGAPRINVAAAANGGTATASQTHSAPYAPSGAINGDRKFYLNNAWANTTATFPQWLQVDFNGSKTIDEIDVFSVQNGTPSEPTPTMIFSTYGVTAFQAQYWDGSAWVTVPNGNVTGNNKVWKQITFSAITTTKIRIWITGSSDGYSRLTEVEAWGTSVPVPRQNVAAAANGGTATASQTHSAPYAPSGAINGDRKFYLNNAWANSTATFPQWLQVDFNGSKTIDEIDVFSVQNGTPSEPTPTMIFSTYGVTAFQAQYWDGSAWVTVSNGSVTGNNLVWKQITFSAITTTKIRIWITGSSDGYSRLTEVEAWGVPSGSGGVSSTVQWLVPDHLGTPRMIFDQTGSLESMKRHDYLPFGEELFAPTGGRTAAMGYASGDSVRQQFTLKERDIETGLDYFLARYYSSIQGRFTGVDSVGPDLANPQTLNKYQYCLNNPLAKVDRNGRYEEDVHRDLTFALALAAGFNVTSARAIANANQGVDDNPETSPMGMTFWGKNVEIREQYHFTTDYRRNELWSKFEIYQSLQDLGVFFHAQQDSFSHEGYGARFGHLKDGHGPDKTFNRPGRADVMALDTFNRMKSALSRLVNYGKETVHYKAVQWKTIMPMVEAFNRARTPQEKQKIINQIVREVQYQHFIQDQTENLIRRQRGLGPINRKKDSIK